MTGAPATGSACPGEGSSFLGPTWLDSRRPVSAAIQARKKVIGFGAGLNFYLSHAALALPLAYVVDDTAGLAGTSACGVRIEPSAVLAAEDPQDVFVVVYADSPRAIFTISTRLEALGWRWGRGYLDSSFLNFESMAPRIEQVTGVAPSWDRFLRARMQRLLMSVQSISYIAGTWLYAELLDNLTRSIPGDIAECGVYKGGNALSTLLISEVANRRAYHLLDSFEGFPDVSSFDLASRRDDFQDVDFQTVCTMFSNFPHVVIHKGWFKDTLPALPDSTYSMVYVDCDLFEPTIDLCTYFWPRLSAGGCMLFHDYWSPDEEPPHQQTFRGVRQAVDGFFGPEAERLIVFPETTHALLVKR